MSFYHDLASLPEWHSGLVGLMYHAIESPPLLHPLRGLYVDPSLLHRQLHELAGANVDLAGLSHWMQNRTSPGRQVAVTFDDAFRSLRANALPLLVELRVCAVTYVVAGQIGRHNDWDAAGGAWLRPLMDRADLLAWQDAGQEIGSHGMSHRHLTRLPRTEARAEIFDSKKKLEDLTGRAVRHFCYPYGDHDEAVRDLVAEAGYETATTTAPGVNDAQTDPLRLRRHLASHRRPYRAAVRGAWLRSMGLTRRPRALTP